MARTTHEQGRPAGTRWTRFGRRAVATFVAVAVALMASALTRRAGNAEPRHQSSTLLRILGEPSTSQAIPPGYVTNDKVLCWFDVTILDNDLPREYVATELAYSDTPPYRDKGMLRARTRTPPGPWETFTVCFDFTIGTHSIFSPAAGKWVSAELNYPGIRKYMLRARADTVGPWERFGIDGDLSNGVTIYSYGANMYASAELAYDQPYRGMLRARSNVGRAWERFFLNKVIGP